MMTFRLKGAMCDFQIYGNKKIGVRGSSGVISSGIERHGKAADVSTCARPSMFCATESLPWEQMADHRCKYPEGTALFSNDTAERGTRRNILLC